MAQTAIIGNFNGQPVQAISLAAPGGLPSARILTWGARLAELWVPDRSGRPADIVLGHDGWEDWRTSSGYLGATCGRFANRIAGGRFVLDGQSVQLDRNEGENHLHGGSEGFDRKLWQVAELGPGHARLTAVSEAGEMGYPGRLQMECSYRFDTAGRLWIEMTATTDAPTVVNMVNHSYFNLAGQGSGTVTAQLLRLGAAHYTPVGPDLIPTGEVRATAGTPFDFAALRPIGQAMPGTGGFDHNFCLSGPLVPKWGGTLRFCAEAADPASGRRLELWTTAPGVQVYTGGGLPATPGKGGVPLGPFAGFALETQGFPDAPNRPQFPPARLDPGQVYRHVMAFDFTPLPG